MLKAYKYRIYPTKEQVVLINRHIGATRFLYNLALETKQTAYSGMKFNMTCFDLNKQIPELKKVCPWLKEINAQSLQASIAHMDNAFNMFFRGVSDFPKYKSKHRGRQSFQCAQNTEIDFENEVLWLPKFKKGIKIVLHKKFKGEMKTVTVSRTPTGKYFASALVENGKGFPALKPIKESTAIGIDLGVKSIMATSDGRTFGNPKFLNERLEHIAFLQRQQSKKKKGSCNWKKYKKKLTKEHETVANKRKDFLNKLSSEIIGENQTVCLEDLNVRGMSARCKPIQDENGRHLPNGQSAKSVLNRNILDSGWGMFVSMLEYKALWNGVNVIKIGRFEPSSKTCSCCGYINRDLELEDRGWKCPKCETVHDRDVNAAKNIKSFALKQYLYTERIRKNPAELPKMTSKVRLGAMKLEATSL